MQRGSKNRKFLLNVRILKLKFLVHPEMSCGGKTDEDDRQATGLILDEMGSDSLLMDGMRSEFMRTDGSFIMEGMRKEGLLLDGMKVKI